MMMTPTKTPTMMTLTKSRQTRKVLLLLSSWPRSAKQKQPSDERRLTRLLWLRGARTTCGVLSAAFSDTSTLARRSFWTRSALIAVVTKRP
jgi:hypothetical protein